MHPATQKLIVLLGLALVQACGEAQGPTNRGGTPGIPGLPQLGEPAPRAELTAPLIPAETFIVGQQRIPKLLKLRALRVGFTSNLAEARFECRSDTRPVFAPCTEALSFDFGPLVQGRQYWLEVRAIGPNGLVDATPASLRFTVDFTRGSDLGLKEGDPARLPPTEPAKTAIKLEDLPAPAATGSAAPPASISREVLLGGIHSLVVPYGMYVRRISSDRNLVDGIVAYRLLGNALDSSQEQTCSKAWERIKRRQDGVAYCEAFPKVEELTSDPQALPVNHVLIETDKAPRGGESLLFLRFTDEEKLFEERYSFKAQCQGATSGSEGATNGWAFALAPEAKDARFGWCLVRDEQRQWWWRGVYRSLWNSGRNGERVVMIHNIPAGGGIQSSTQFEVRSRSLLPKVFVFNPNMSLNRAPGG